MLKIKEYVKAESLEQAYELNQKKNNCILGGMLWLKMENRNVQTAIDLSALGLDNIEETQDEFTIGAMVTLRQLEENEALNRFTDGAVRESVKSIVGVQFRNLATVGGSIFSRFGFSDVLTMFLALDSYVELYRGGIVSLEEYAYRKRDRDILVRLIVKKHPVKCVYLSHRNSKTDFPVLTCAISVGERGARSVIGARPGRAVCLPIEEEALQRIFRVADTPGKEDSVNAAEELAKALAAGIVTGSNMRGSAEYRSLLAKVLIKRGLETLAERGLSLHEDTDAVKR